MTRAVARGLLLLHNNARVDHSGNLMPLSDAAAREIANVLRKYVATKALEQIVNELLEIRGDKDFRDTIERLVHALQMADR